MKILMLSALVTLILTGGALAKPSVNGIELNVSGTNGIELNLSGTNGIELNLSGMNSTAQAAHDMPHIDLNSLQILNAIIWH